MIQTKRTSAMEGYWKKKKNRISILLVRSRVKKESGLNKLVYKNENLKITKNWAAHYPYALCEPLMWFWTSAEWDRDVEVIVEEERTKDIGAEWTTWIVMAADFYFLTGTPLCKTGEVMEF